MNKRLIQELKRNMKNSEEFRGLDLSQKNVREYLSKHILNQIVENTIVYKVDKEHNRLYEGGLETPQQHHNSAICLTIPSGSNEHGIEPGDYDLNGIVELLRDHKNDPDAIQYIADMMEE